MIEPRGDLDPRRAARYAAIQALYQIDLTDAEPIEVVAEFERHRLDDLFVRDETGSQSQSIDRELFQELVLGTTARQSELDAALRPQLAAGWSLERCGFPLRAMLRAGAFELAARPQTSVATIVTEYVELARGFFDGNEPGFLHAVLDHSAPVLRRPPTSLADLVEPGAA